MKKSILLMLVSGSCLVTAAQMPDTTRQQQLNGSTPLDSTRMAPQAAPVEVAPVITQPSTLNVAPATPMNTDVRNNAPLADTINAVIPATTSATADTTTVVVPVVPFTTGDTMLITTPAAPVKENMQAVHNMQNNTNYTLPRGVHVPEASMISNGLGKWSALPILNTYVPQEIVNKLKGDHGDKLYDITMIKTGDSQYAYNARIQENGVYTTIMINDNITSSVQ